MTEPKKPSVRYDGDEEDVYECAIEGCRAKEVRYIPR